MQSTDDRRRKPGRHTARRATAGCAATLLLVTGLAGIALPARAAEPGQVSFTGVEKVVAFADVHGAYDDLTGLLKATGMVDAGLKWSGGRTHLVSTGDLLDRGKDSRKVMDLLMRLQGEAAAAGGQLHVTLGNHEAMNLLGHVRDVAPGELEAYAAEEPPASASACAPRGSSATVRIRARPSTSDSPRVTSDTGPCWRRKDTMAAGCTRCQWPS